MANYKAKGIILKRSNLGEADRIISIFTKEQGKIKALAKGIRQPLSRMAGHLEPFCLTSLVLAEGRNFDIITETQTIKCYFSLRNNLKTTQIAYYLAEIIEKLTPEREPQSKIFQLLEEVLQKIDKGNLNLLIPFFEINFAKIIGFQPELYHCLLCRKKIVSNDHYFSFEQGGLVCQKCRQSDRPISSQAIKVLRLLLKGGISVLSKIKIDKKLAKEVGEITADYLRYLHQKEFKSRRFLEK